LDAAASIFREVGFERASMSAICARAGGSKTTLYTYFSSKEELFFEVMFSAADAKFKISNRFLDLAGELDQALRHVGENMLTLMYSPAMMAARRLIAAESARSGLGRECHARGPQKAGAFLAEFLAGAMHAGKLRRTDPAVAALHLRGLLESELLDRFLFNLADAVSPEEIKVVTARAVETFLAAYGAR
jgi:AcrR family transcriptional regulator